MGARLRVERETLEAGADPVSGQSDEGLFEESGIVQERNGDEIGWTAAVHDGELGGIGGGLNIRDDVGWIGVKVAIDDDAEGGQDEACDPEHGVRDVDLAELHGRLTD